MTGFSRRDFLILSMGAVAAGCAQESSVRIVRPGVTWPAYEDRPAPAPPPRVVTPAPAPSSELLQRGPVAAAIPRAQWSKSSPIMSRLNPLGRVTRITVHHEGSSAVWFSDYTGSARRLELVRQAHVKRGWADIGYHFVIDRSGRVWQGRDLRYQGAHVKNNNESNVGVMVLGNFEKQSPTSAQIASLRATVSDLMRYYHVPVSRVYTHRELGPTECPGRALQPQMVSLRRNGQLA